MSYPRYPEYRDTGIEWLRDIPAHWNAKRLRRVCQINPLRSETQSIPGDTLVSFVPMEAIGEDGSLQASELRALADVGGGYTYFRDHDVLVAKITPCFENGKGALCRNLHNGIGLGTTELHVLRAGPEIDAAFMFHLTRSSGFHEQGEAAMYGAGGQKRVPADFIENFAIALPPLAEQRAIAAFLDAETARIDALVAKQEALIATLQEKRRALISHVVTKGLDPAAPMRDSGVPWLGEVPAHWEVLKTRRITIEHKQGYYTEQSYIDEGVKLIRITDIDDFANINFSNMPFVQVTPDNEGAFGVGQGDFLFARSGTIGRFGIVQYPERSVFASYLIRFRFNAYTEFLRYSFKSQNFQEGLLRSLHGGANHNVHAEDIKEQYITLPPISEQTVIADYLDRETTHIDTLIAKAQEMIAVLREHRTALVAAAVTGQIDVRGYRDNGAWAR
ncbi:restriction endonuclease subunit S [Oscillochloris sp. ZM17-4]|uniref:restriction endonuclease subunit S n=1 Tax=Oscillochloris sp. ZM17-4 TaxID=2866714 RepID=UPI001C73A497|nr:restriction endonuclease subunit S [Oscillochloris sp. ZM17-4]MBX0329990.1 restriction endonuclease subunit S [Oscillochloris sp. ZM17-4]